MIFDKINELAVPFRILIWAGIVIVAGLLIWGASRLIRFIFGKIEAKKGLHLTFFRHIATVLFAVGLVFLIVSSLSGLKSVWETVLGGTAIASAVIAFVAQDVIKDILAGLMLSIHHPFVIGDRIVLEDGMNGIVADMTLRHVVLIGIDGVRHVVPNSKINAMKLTNFSFGRDDRSVQLKFSVGYGSDMELVKRVIYDAVRESPYAIPGGRDADGNPCYAQPYFLAFADSALVVQVTAYYASTTRTELIIDDVNARVREALTANGVEIPYAYLNLITQPQQGTVVSARTGTAVPEEKENSAKKADTQQNQQKGDE